MEERGATRAHIDVAQSENRVMNVFRWRVVTSYLLVPIKASRSSGCSDLEDRERHKSYLREFPGRMTGHNCFLQELN
jgi:hypothetical protein